MITPHTITLYSESRPTATQMKDFVYGLPERMAIVVPPKKIGFNISHTPQKDQWDMLLGEELRIARIKMSKEKTMKGFAVDVTIETFFRENSDLSPAQAVYDGKITALFNETVLGMVDAQDKDPSNIRTPITVKIPLDVQVVSHTSREEFVREVITRLNVPRLTPIRSVISGVSHSSVFELPVISPEGFERIDADVIFHPGFVLVTLNPELLVKLPVEKRTTFALEKIANAVKAEVYGTNAQAKPIPNAVKDREITLTRFLEFEDRFKIAGAIAEKVAPSGPGKGHSVRQHWQDSPTEIVIYDIKATDGTKIAQVLFADKGREGATPLMRIDTFAGSVYSNKELVEIAVAAVNEVVPGAYQHPQEFAFSKVYRLRDRVWVKDMEVDDYASNFTDRLGRTSRPVFAILAKDRCTEDTKVVQYVDSQDRTRVYAEKIYHLGMRRSEYPKLREAISVEVRFTKEGITEIGLPASAEEIDKKIREKNFCRNVLEQGEQSNPAGFTMLWPRPYEKEKTRETEMRNLFLETLAQRLGLKVSANQIMVYEKPEFHVQALPNGPESVIINFPCSDRTSIMGIYFSATFLDSLTADARRNLPTTIEQVAKEVEGRVYPKVKEQQANTVRKGPLEASIVKTAVHELKAHLSAQQLQMFYSEFASYYRIHDLRVVPNELTKETNVYGKIWDVSHSEALLAVVRQRYLGGTTPVLYANIQPHLLRSRLPDEMTIGALENDLKKIVSKVLANTAQANVPPSAVQPTRIVEQPKPQATAKAEPTPKVEARSAVPSSQPILAFKEIQLVQAVQANNKTGQVYEANKQPMELTAPLRTNTLEMLESKILSGCRLTRQWTGNLDLNTMRVDNFSAGEGKEVTHKVTLYHGSTTVPMPQVIVKEYSGFGGTVKVYGIVGGETIASIASRPNTLRSKLTEWQRALEDSKTVLITTSTPQALEAINERCKKGNCEQQTITSIPERLLEDIRKIGQMGNNGQHRGHKRKH